MRIIGLTGSIGMGKSVTAHVLRRLNIPVFDSDACVHELLDGQAKAFILNKFPDCKTKENRIDRQKLGLVIYKNPEARTCLELILHPMVWEAQRQFLARHQRARRKRVVLDIPLLYETGRDRICDLVICVSAPQFLQKQRVLRRPNMTEDKFLSIVKAQMPDRQKRLLSDNVIPTGLGFGFALRRIKKALRLDG